MPQRSPLKLLLTLIFIVSLVIFINKQFLENKLSFGPISLYGQEPAVYTFRKLSEFKNIFSSIGTVSGLINRNLKLEKRNSELVSNIAELEALRLENDFLRKSLNISLKSKPELEVGNIYTWSFGPNGYSVLLNKGSRDGISTGNIIISEDKVLIGTVEKTETNFSRVLAITDPRFKITARVLGSDTAGIVNGTLHNSLSFNLIIQDDKIKEGDTVVSSGNDSFPDSLVIGRVSKIEVAEDQ